MKLKTLQPRISPAPSRRLRIAPNTDSWRGDKTAHERGYGSRWQRARLAYLSKHPLCVYCDAKGLTTLAQVVDHIQPHKGDAGLFWNVSNWQPLCKPCHDSEKRRQEASPAGGVPKT